MSEPATPQPYEPGWSVLEGTRGVIYCTVMRVGKGEPVLSSTDGRVWEMVGVTRGRWHERLWRWVRRKPPIAHYMFRSQP